MSNTSTPIGDIFATRLPWAAPPEDSSPSNLLTSNPLSVRFAQMTFDAEGLESRGPFFSRSISYPGGDSSGVTIGRGYDLGRRSATQIIKELAKAGVSDHDAKELSRAAGLRGTKASEYVEIHRETAPVITLEAQRKLFEDVVTPDIVSDIKRIFVKPDTIRSYGEASWEDLSRTAQELVFDLRYRGDYTPTTRRRIQRPLVTQDYQRLQEVMNDTAYWRSLGVPLVRIRERQEIARGLG